MRKAVFVVALLFSGGSLLGACGPYLMIADLRGEYNCEQGDHVFDAIDFISASSGRNSLTVVKRVDKTSGQLFLWSAREKHIPWLVMVLPSQQMKYTMTDVLVRSVSHGAVAGTEAVAFSPTVGGNLDIQKMQIQISPSGPCGWSLDPEYDIGGNTPV